MNTIIQISIYLWTVLSVRFKSGDLVLKEHEAAAWLTKEILHCVDWLPADQGLIEIIENYLKED